MYRTALTFCGRASGTSGLNGPTVCRDIKPLLSTSSISCAPFSWVSSGVARLASLVYCCVGRTKRSLFAAGCAQPVVPQLTECYPALLVHVPETCTHLGRRAHVLWHPGTRVPETLDAMLVLTVTGLTRVCRQLSHCDSHFSVGTVWLALHLRSQEENPIPCCRRYILQQPVTHDVFPLLPRPQVQVLQ